MKTKNYFHFFLVVLCALFSFNILSAQCTQYAAPTSSGYTNFNTNFGGAPCDSGNGLPIDQITTFEIFASEAYAVENFIEGGMYEFNICEGPGAGNWVPEFTIVAPSGAVDAFGSGTDSCRIAWTASESGTYQIIINEAGECGGGSNTGTANGFPTLTTLGNAVCPDDCLVWYSPGAGEGFPSFNDAFGGAPCDSGNGCDTFEITNFEVWAAETYAIDNFIAGGEYQFGICNGPGASSWMPDFTIISPSGNVDASGADDGGCTITWTASESGTYLIAINEVGECGGGPNRQVDNGFPSITCLGGAVCVDCSAGMVTSDLDMVVCGSLDSLTITIEGVTFPEGGGLGYNFVPGEGATGGREGGFFISNGNPNTTWNNDINGLMSSNNFDPLGGPWEISPFTYINSDSIVETLCEFTDETVLAYFNPDLTVVTQDIGGGQATASVSGGTGPYSYLWSDSEGQTSDTIDAEVDGEYTVNVTDDVGCTAIASVMIMSTAVENLPGVEDIMIAPNPTNGQLYVNVSLTTITDVSVQIIDVNGRTLAQQKVDSMQGRLSFDLSDFANGLYLVKVTSGKTTSTTQRVLLAK